jgi:histone deacetylase complex regulatory component SIN3
MSVATSIVFRSGNIHHTLANSITTNSLTVHAPSPPPVSVYNNSHVSTAQAQAVSQALSQADGVSTGGQTQQSQPVEFNHAINYVNKIKVRLLLVRKGLYETNINVKQLRRCNVCKKNIYKIILFLESVSRSTR